VRSMVPEDTGALQRRPSCDPRSVCSIHQATCGAIAEVGVDVVGVEGSAGSQPYRQIWAPTLPSSSSWLTLDDVPPASISSMIRKPMVASIDLRRAGKMKRLGGSGAVQTGS